jgi:SAM-dependent methyltransferase
MVLPGTPTLNRVMGRLSKNLIAPRFRPWVKTIYNKVRFFGFRYQCPLCKSFVRTFCSFGDDFPVLKQHKVIGGGYRLNAQCPVCDSLDRERLLFLYLLRKTNVFAARYRLLHVAPETALEKILRQKTNLDYVTADLLAPGVMIKMDLTDIPFPDHYFDAIICNHVLEHIIDDRKAMSELYRVLKPSGWAITQVPISLTLETTYEDASITAEKAREQAFGQSDHVRIYAKDYKKRLEQTGFKVNIFDWTTETDNFGGSKNLFGLVKNEGVYIATRI